MAYWSRAAPRTTPGISRRRYAEILRTNDGGPTTEHLYGLDRLASNDRRHAHLVRRRRAGQCAPSARFDQRQDDPENARADPWSQVERGLSPSFGFTGELQDDAGMVYLRARWYASGSGTLSSRDPFEGHPEWPDSLIL